ncbi:unnamed protein product [Amaranthus hypochondriacus]
MAVLCADCGVVGLDERPVQIVCADWTEEVMGAVFVGLGGGEEERLLVTGEKLEFDCGQLANVIGAVEDHFDPMLLSDAAPYTVGSSLPSPIDTTMGEAKRPRGRPKTHKGRCVGKAVGVTSTEEAMITWDLAKRVGVDSCDEAAALKGIRKSKRLIIMEDHEAHAR